MDLRQQNKRLLAIIYAIAAILLVLFGCFYLHSFVSLTVNIISSIVFVLGGVVAGLFLNEKKNMSSEKLLLEYKRIQDSKEKFDQNYPRLYPLMLSIIEERVQEIEDAARGKLSFKTEIQRESFTSKLFGHLDKVPNLKKIQSLTWDYDGFFSDQWIAAIKLEDFVERNRKAKENGIEIQRLFIFRKGNTPDKIKEVFATYQEATRKAMLPPMKFLYEQDLASHKLESFIKTPSSFLLFIDHLNRVKIHSENCKVSTNELCKMEAIFYNDQDLPLNEKQARFNMLWEEPCKTSF